MRRLIAAATVAVLVGGMAGCAGTWGDKPRAALTATALMKNRAGEDMGLATLQETTRGTEITVSVVRLSPGVRGVHIHAVGLCEGPDFASAGGHFNPSDTKHGSSRSGHAGDLPNITVGPEGYGRIELTTRNFTLRPGTPRSLFKDKGTAIVLHAQADDEQTDPAGNSGDRIACGVIVLNP